MATVFIVPRPKGDNEDTPIDHYVAETEGDRALGTFKTQEGAIAWGKSNGHTLHVARVRHLPNKRIPDHWRKV